MSLRTPSPPSIQELLNQRRAAIAEQLKEKDPVARAMLQYEIEDIDRELLNRGYGRKLREHGRLALAKVRSSKASRVS